MREILPGMKNDILYSVIIKTKKLLLNAKFVFSMKKSIFVQMNSKISNIF